MKAQDATLFPRFADSVQSGQRVRINLAIDEMDDKFRIALSETYHQTNLAANASGAGPDCLALAAAVAAVVVWLAAAVANVAAVVNAVDVLNVAYVYSPAASGNSRYAREAWVDKLARDLH
jgi:SdpC family antimicrobial peptide